MKNWKALNHTNTLVIPYIENDGFPEVIQEKLGCSIPLEAKKGTITNVYTLGKMPMEKIVFVSCGDGKNIKDCFTAVAKELKDEKEVSVYVNEDTAYRAGLYLTYGKYTYKETYETKYICSGYEQLFNDGIEMAESMNMARRLADTPPNILYSTVLKDEAVAIAEKYNAEVKVYSNDELKELGTNGILAVNAGSAHPAYIVMMKYNGNGDAPYVGLIGKGLTYDAGGYNLKRQMPTMKYDMCGAANSLATFDYVAKKQLKVNFMCVIGITDNMINENAYFADVVLNMMNGKTVEINNTDAEGRLVLVDCLMMAQKENVSHLMDIATLTGACFRALGDRYTGIFTNSQEFYKEFEKANEECEELIWQLPLDQGFHDAIRNSSVADMTNAQPGVSPGACLAAAFIEEFVDEQIPWIHIDIAGTELFSSSPTGTMIQTISKLLENMSQE